MIGDDKENLLKDMLLDELAREMRCDYLSDLRLPTSRLFLIPLLNHIDLEKYSVSEWNDAVQYIIGERRMFKNQSDARNYMMSQILTRKV